MPAVDKGDGHLGQFGHGGIVEAVHADADKRPAARRIAAAKWAHAAMAAKIMALAAGRRKAVGGTWLAQQRIFRQ